MIFAGIDYSMKSPAICIHDGADQKIDTCLFYNLSDLKKSQGLYTSANLRVDPLPVYSCNEERYDKISEWAMSILDMHCVDKVFLEGYSYGSSAGLVFNIAENTGLLKHKMWTKGIECVTLAPLTVKRWATGNGNANKQLLNETFVLETGIDFKSMLSLTDKQWNPSSDLVDSYYILNCGCGNEVGTAEQV